MISRHRRTFFVQAAGLCAALAAGTRAFAAAPPVEGRSEEDRITETTGRVRTAIEAGLTDLLAKRRGIFV